MTILCAGDCHVWLGASSICTCQEERLALLFPNYNPYAPQKATPPTTKPVPDVPLNQFKAAQDVQATHLSADGKIAYDERKYGLWYCKWDEETKAFGAWWRMDDGLTPDAVRM